MGRIRLPGWVRKQIAALWRLTVVTRTRRSLFRSARPLCRRRRGQSTRRVEGAPGRLIRVAEPALGRITIGRSTCEACRRGCCVISGLDGSVGRDVRHPARTGGILPLERLITCY